MPDTVSEPSGLGPMAAACSAAIGLGSALVLSAGDALFLHRVGPEHLGTAFAISSALLVLVLSAVGARADRGGRESLLLSISGISAVVLVAAAFLASSAPRLTASIVLVGGKQMAAALELAFWALLAERFDARQLRRALPTLIAAGGAGLAVGAGLVALLAGVVGVPALAISGALAFLVAGVFGSRLARRGALRPLPRAKLPKRPSSLGLIAGARAVRASPVASRLVLLVVLGGASTPIIHYLLGVRAAATFGNEAELATFFGGFRAAVQVVTVLAQALLASRWIARAGIGNSMVCAPLVALGAAIALMIRPELAAVVIAQAAIKLVDGAIETPAMKLAQNLTSRDVRGRVSGFLDGVAKRAGSVAGGALAATLAPEPVVIAAAAIAVAWVAAAFVFRRNFPELAVRELSDRSTRTQAPDDDAVLDRGGLAALRAAVLRGGAAGLRARLLLAELDGNGVDYSAELARAICQSDGGLRESLASEFGARIDCGLQGAPRAEDLKQLAASDLESLSLLGARFGQPGSDVTPEHATARKLASLREEGAVGLIHFEGGELAERELCRTLAIGCLDEDDEPRAVRRLTRLAKSEASKTNARKAALFALRSFSERQLVDLDESAAAKAEWLLVSASIAELAESLANSKGSSRIRAAAIELWATVGGGRVAMDVATHLGSPDRRVARAATASLKRLAADAAEPLLRVAIFGRRRAREPALDLLRELRVPPAVLDELIEREADAVARSAIRLPGLRGLPGAGLLLRRVGERITESAHTLFLLIETRLGRASIGDAARRLRHARHRLARARAIEALDAVLPRRFVPILAALEGSMDGAEAAADYIGVSIPKGGDAVRAELGGSDRLARRIAIFSLGDDGRSEYAGEITQAAKEAYSEAAPDEIAARMVSLLGTGGAGDTVASSSDNGDQEEMSKSIESVIVLSELALFADLTTRELAELAEVVSWVTATSGDVLMTEGEVGEAMYFVVEGEVVVEREASAGEKVLATLGRGEPFGEMALFDDEVRSATVTAGVGVRLGRIERPAFEEIVAEVPGIALGICRALSRRVRNLE